MTEELKPIDVSKYTVTESGNVIRTDNKETLKNALERITELEKENTELKEQIEEMKSDVMANIKWADKNCDNMWQKLVKMWNQWERKE